MIKTECWKISIVLFIAMLRIDAIAADCTPGEILTVSQETSQGRDEGQTLTLECPTGTRIASWTSLYGLGCSNCNSGDGLSCGSCTVGATSCSVWYHNDNCGDCHYGCIKQARLTLNCECAVAADIQISMSASISSGESEAAPGDVIAYTLTATAGSEASSLTLKDSIPRGTQVVKSSVSNSGKLKDGKLTWNFKNVTSQTVTFKVKVDSFDDLQAGLKELLNKGQAQAVVSGKTVSSSAESKLTLNVPTPEFGTNVPPSPAFARVGQTVKYMGKYWKKKGGAIKIYWGKKLLKSISEKSSFNGSFRLLDFPTNNQSGCSGELKAQQGSTKKSVTLPGSREDYYYYASGVKQGSKEIKSGSWRCDGTEASYEKESAYLAGLTTQQAVRLSDNINDLFAMDVYFGPSSTIVIPNASGHPVSVTPIVGISPIVQDIASFEPTSGFVDITGDTFEAPSDGRSFTLDVLYRRIGDLQFNCDVWMVNALLFVNGSVRINGKVGGEGSIIATGDITVTKSLSLSRWGDEADGRHPVSLLAGGTLKLEGK